MRYILLAILAITAIGALFWYSARPDTLSLTNTDDGGLSVNLTNNPADPASHPLTIATLRSKIYPGSEIVIEEKLNPGSNYARARVSYQSDGNSIYALMTIPSGSKPEGGWPVIIFNHGYIPPKEYRTTEKYVAYQDGFARNGYITLKSDYRGHGESEGEPSGGYGSDAYTTDVLNALASIRKYPDANPQQIGMWGHSMGGHITLRAMVADQNIKASVIWAGVVGSYPDLISNWRRSSPPPTVTTQQRRWRQVLQDTYGSPQDNPEFWNSISATSYLSEVSGPIQIHHGTADSSVPSVFSVSLDEKLKTANKVSELFIYQGDNHNLSQNFNLAMRRSIDFFDRYVKNGM